VQKKWGISGLSFSSLICGFHFMKCSLHSFWFVLGYA